MKFEISLEETHFYKPIDQPIHDLPSFLQMAKGRLPGRLVFRFRSQMPYRQAQAREASDLGPRRLSAPEDIEHSFQRASAPRRYRREVIQQLKERRNLRASCPLSIVDFDAQL